MKKNTEGIDILKNIYIKEKKSDEDRNQQKITTLTRNDKSHDTKLLGDSLIIITVPRSDQ